MQKIEILINSIELDFDHAISIAETVCKNGDDDPFLIS